MLKRKNPRFYLFGIVFLLAILFSASVNADYPGEEDFITIVCDLDGEFVFPVETLMNDFEPVTEQIIRRDNEGQIYDEYPIKGVLFADVLSSIGREKGELNSIRLRAGDGYSVEVPGPILLNREIILAYEIDEEPLFEGTRPIRVFIPEEEAMYWVRNTVEISLNSKEEVKEAHARETTAQEDGLEKIYFFETMFSVLEEIDYPEGENQKAVRAEDLLADIEPSETVYMLATDDFEKNEEYETVLGAYFLTQGENTPAFRSPDLPRGMHIRDLAYISLGNTGIVCVENAIEMFPPQEINENVGVGFMVFFEIFGLKKADSYHLEAIDGFSAEVSYEDLIKGIVHIRESGQIASLFEDLPRNTAIRDLLFIKPIEK